MKQEGIIIEPQGIKSKAVSMLQPKLKVTIDYRKCQPEKYGCDKGVCPAIDECPVKLWKQEEPYDSPYPVAGFCQECGKCVEACPLEAIRML